MSEDQFDWVHGSSHEMHKIPVSTLLRWFLYDVNASDAKENIEIFNLTAVSEEGHEKETEDSDARMEEIVDLLPFLSFYANATADYAFALNKKYLLEIPGITEEVIEASEEPLKSFYINLAMSALISAFASATELSIIRLNGTHTEIKKESNE